MDWQTNPFQISCGCVTRQKRQDAILCTEALWMLRQHTEPRMHLHLHHIDTARTHWSVLRLCVCRCAHIGVLVCVRACVCV